MAYSFDRDERVGEGLRRNAGSQVADALAALDDPSALGLVESVHDVRKRCKKLRALARMARKSIDDYQATNAAFRDAARELSDIRDAQMLVELFDALVASTPEGMTLPDVSPARQALVARCDDVTAGLRDDDAPLLRARALVAQGWDRVRGWQLDDDFEVLAGGLAKTYGRAVDGFHGAMASPTDEQLHEWRKRVKYHWYHVRMFTDSAPQLLEPWAHRLHDLSDALGDDHDLALFTARLDQAPHEHGGHEVVDALRVLADGRRAELQRRALSLGARLTAEDPDAVVGRLRVCWDAWRHHGDAPRATQLADLATTS